MPYAPAGAKEEGEAEGNNPNVEAKTFFSVNSPAPLGSLACCHRRVIMKFSLGYLMQEDCTPLFVGQKSISLFFLICLGKVSIA